MAALIAVLILSMSLGGAAHASLEEGTYTANYVVLKAEDDSVSMANDYWEKPATVVITGDQATVQLTVNHSEWVTEFKVPGGSGYVDTTVVATNKSEDTRRVEFSTAAISEPILAKIHVTVPEMSYDHDYTIRLVFDMDSFVLSDPAETVQDNEATDAEQQEPVTAPLEQQNALDEPKVDNPSQTEPSTDVKAEPEAKPEPKPAPEAKPEPEPEPQPEAIPEPEVKSETKPEQESEATLEVKSETQADPSDNKSAIPTELDEEEQTDKKESSNQAKVERSMQDNEGIDASEEAAVIKTSTSLMADPATTDDMEENTSRWMTGWTSGIAILVLLAIGGVVYALRRRSYGKH